MQEHSFSIEDAEKYGVECAVLLKNIRFWLDKNLANSKHLKEGKVWTYNSAKAFAELFPYLSEKQIYRRLEKLEADGIIITGNFNELNYDKTKWYTVNESKYNLFPADGQSLSQNRETLSRNREIELPESGNRIPEMGKPIPDSNTDSKPYSKKEFLQDWNELRVKHLTGCKASNLNYLTREDQSNLKELSEAYTREQFREALTGLFKQKKMPNDNSTMQSNPKHFLTHFNAYLTAFHDRNTSLYGKELVNQ